MHAFTFGQVSFRVHLPQTQMLPAPGGRRAVLNIEPSMLEVYRIDTWQKSHPVCKQLNVFS